MNTTLARILDALHIRPREATDPREVLVVEMPESSLKAFIRVRYEFEITVTADVREQYRQCDVMFDGKLIHRTVFWPVTLWPGDSFYFHGRIWLTPKTDVDWFVRRR